MFSRALSWEIVGVHACELIAGSSEFRGRLLMNVTWSHRIICTDSMTYVCSAMFCSNSAVGCASAIITSVCTCVRPAAWQQTKSLACAHFCFQRLTFEPQKQADCRVMKKTRLVGLLELAACDSPCAVFVTWSANIEIP